MSDLVPLLVRDEAVLGRVLASLSITVTEMFRDHAFFGALRRSVVPVLRTYPFSKVWVAGCATGEEAYSVAIMLAEEGLGERTHVYATDINRSALDVARTGIYRLEPFEASCASYRDAGGTGRLEDYYVARYGHAKVSERLQRNVTFAYHNLVTDGVFGEMNLILCRNVLIYFDRTLQDQVLSMFRASLCRKGFLSLGTKETVRYSAVGSHFESFDATQKIFRERGGALEPEAEEVAA
jgi:chemotaxis protein methyltransferase CheR